MRRQKERLRATVMVAWRADGGLENEGCREVGDQQRTAALARCEVGHTELGDVRCEKEVPKMTPRSLT